MICIIVGLGYFGKIIQSKLKKLEYEYYTCDPYVEASDYKCISDVKIEDPANIYWFVTTPASTHKSVIISIVKNACGRNIWVEKPVCMTYNETTELDVFLKANNVNLYCDFTWLEHTFIKTIDTVFESDPNALFFKMKIVQPKMIDYTKNDACIVMDLAPHPVSIIQYILEKTESKLENVSVYSVSIDKIAITGVCSRNFNFLIEFDNTTSAKYRTLDYISNMYHIYWDTYTDKIMLNNESYTASNIDNNDAIERNIIRYLNNKQSNVNYLCVAHILQMIMDAKNKA